MTSSRRALGAPCPAQLIQLAAARRVCARAHATACRVCALQVRTVQSNLSKGHDAYVNTNCLAALANLAPCLRKLHPHAARSLVTLCDVLCRKYTRRLRAENPQAAGEPPAGDDMRSPAEMAAAALAMPPMEGSAPPDTPRPEGGYGEEVRCGEEEMHSATASTCMCTCACTH